MRGYNTTKPIVIFDFVKLNIILLTLLVLVIGGCGSGNSSVISTSNSPSSTPQSDNDKNSPIIVITPPPPPILVVNPVESQNQVSWGLTAIGVSAAYSYGLTGQGVVVEQLGFGVDKSHPKFTNQLIDNIYNGNDVSELSTETAGIIVARKETQGLYGVAYDAKLLAVNINNSKLDNAYNLAMNNNARIVQHDITNLDNLGSNPLTIYSNWTALSNPHRAIMVTPAGNPAIINSNNLGLIPTQIPDSQNLWINVVAVDSNLKLLPTGNNCGMSQNWCIAAPGDQITTTAKNGGYVKLSNSPNSSSIAAAYVTGAASLLTQLYPNLTLEQITQILFTSATDIGTPGIDNIYGNGFLNIKAALEPLGDLVVSNGTNFIPIHNSIITTSSVFGNLNNLPNAIIGFDNFNRPYQISFIINKSNNDFSFTHKFLNELNRQNLSIYGNYRNLNYIIFYQAPNLTSNFSKNSNPFIAYAENSLGAKFSSSNLELAFFIDHDAFATLISLTNHFSNFELMADIGYLHENNSIFGSNLTDVFASSHGSNTYFSDLGSKIFLSDHSYFYGLYDYCVSIININNHSLAYNITPLFADSIKLGYLHKELFFKRDDIDFSISQPLRLTKGKLDLKYLSAIDARGNKTFNNYNVSLVPSGREVDFTITYNLNLNSSISSEASIAYKYMKNNVKNNDRDAELLYKFTLRF